MSLALYRKYRSQTFSDLIGQDHVVRTIQNGITTGRIAHSYLFTGPRGTGKTSTARLLAKALCCECGPTPEPDNTCEICRSITDGTCVDVVEMDAASDSGVEDVREKIVGVVEYRPMVCRYKVFIIDEVHDLSAKAFDALLKTIEEPPPHIIFILATTEYNKVPPTIRSRCQKFEFHRGSLQDLAHRLTYVTEQEGATAEPAAISAIARMADGGYRDALTLLEHALVTSDGHITLAHVYDQLGLVNEETVDALLLAMHDANVPAIMDLLAEVARHGRDPRAVLESMMYRLADLTRASFQVQLGALDASSEAALHELAARLGRETLLRLRASIADAHRAIRDISLPRLWLEAELIRIATAPALPVPAQAAAPTPQPRAQRSQPEAKPAPKPAPPPTREEPEPEIPKPSETTAPAPAEATANGVWGRIMSDAAAYSRTLGMKLVGTRVAVEEPDRLVVEFTKESFFDWVRENKRVMAYLREQVRQHKGPSCEFEIALKKEETLGSLEPGAVELPAEGQRLEQLAREVFGV